MRERKDGRYCTRGTWDHAAVSTPPKSQDGTRRRSTNSGSPINVFLGTDGLGDCALPICTHMWAQGELNQDTTDGMVVIEPLDDLDDLIYLGLFGECHMLEFDADLLCSLGFHANIDDRVWSLASLDDSKLRLEARVS